MRSAQCAFSIQGGGGGAGDTEYAPDDEEYSREPIKCPECGSTNWRCWDELTHYFYDKETDCEYAVPIGYLVCKDCKRSWIDDDGIDWADEITEDEGYD